MKKFSPLRMIHMILMIGLAICSSFTTFMFFGGFDMAVSGKNKPEVIIDGCITLVVTAMLLTGILYLVHGYKKMPLSITRHLSFCWSSEKIWAGRRPDIFSL